MNWSDTRDTNDECACIDNVPDGKKESPHPMTLKDHRELGFSTKHERHHPLYMKHKCRMVELSTVKRCLQTTVESTLVIILPVLDLRSNVFIKALNDIVQRTTERLQSAALDRPPLQEGSR